MPFDQLLRFSFDQAARAYAFAASFIDVESPLDVLDLPRVIDLLSFIRLAVESRRFQIDFLRSISSPLLDIAAAISRARACDGR